MKTLLNLACPMALLLCVGIAQAGADEKTKKAARAALAKHQDAVVTIKASGTTTIEVDGQDAGTTKFNIEITGTMLTADGITAVCSQTLGLFGSGIPMNGAKEKTEFEDVQIILASGRKVPAAICEPDEKDAKIGVAFVAPKQRDLKLSYVSLDKGRIPAILEDVIYLSRLTEAFDRELDVGIVRASAVLKKQKAIVVDGAAEGGAMALDAEGRPFGVCVVRTPSEDRGNLIIGPRDYAVVVTQEALQAPLEKARKKWKAAKQ